MAATIHDNIRLDTDLDGSGLPVNTYPATQEAGTQLVLDTPVVIERALTGKLHVHRVTDGSNMLQFENYRYQLILTRAQKDALKLDAGKILYFMPHYRDDADTTTYRSLMLLLPFEALNIDPREEWWTAEIELVEATGQTADT